MRFVTNKVVISTRVHRGEVCLRPILSVSLCRCSLAFKNNIISKALSAIYKYLYTNRGISNKSITTGATSGVEIAYYTGTSYSPPVFSWGHFVQFFFLCKGFLITLIPFVIAFTFILCSTASGYPLVSLNVYWMKIKYDLLTITRKAIFLLFKFFNFLASIMRAYESSK